MSLISSLEINTFKSSKAIKVATNRIEVLAIMELRVGYEKKFPESPNHK